MKNSLVLSILHKVIIFVAGLVVCLLFFGYVLPDYIITDLPAQHKTAALDILTKAAYVAYFLSFFICIFLPSKFQPPKTWQKLILFLLIYVLFWFAYIYFA